MLTKSAFAATLLLAAAMPARAEPSAVRDCGTSATQAAQLHDRDASAPELHGVPHTPILVLAPDPLGDILSARGPEPHAAAFARFAAYAAIGNSDGAQIISAQLRGFGVARDQLRDLADRAALHTASIPRPVRTD